MVDLFRIVDSAEGRPAAGSETILSFADFRNLISLAGRGRAGVALSIR